MQPVHKAVKSWKVEYLGIHRADYFQGYGTMPENQYDFSIVGVGFSIYAATDDAMEQLYDLEFICPKTAWKIEERTGLEQPDLLDNTPLEEDEEEMDTCLQHYVGIKVALL